jgi:hypothetical protein
MNSAITRIRTGLALGPRNIVRALAYRMGVRTRVHPALRLHADFVPGPFFRSPEVTRSLPARREWIAETHVFGRWAFPISDTPPNWSANPLDDTRFPAADRPWWRIDDFGAGLDIKTVWEFSRFDWAIAFSQQAASGNIQAFERLEAWLTDWITRNPPYLGPNWKCGQEASIRVIHLAAAALILRQLDVPEPGLVRLIELHLARIAPTTAYAVSQDNNHGTSEAVALFVGGSWLAAMGSSRGERWGRQGRTLLEERIARLVGRDGGFSQYSINYHRLMLDTLSFAEVWRRQNELPPFSERLTERAAVAADWLFAQVHRESGDAPNVGANDGAHILRLTDEPYRDYRPSTDLAIALFRDLRAYPLLPSGDVTLAWLGVAVPAGILSPPASRIDWDNGFAVLRGSRAMALMRFPRYRFRPSQADALHVDLWLDGTNLLRDGGSFGYNEDERWTNYFNGTQGHNTVQFDGRDQMPRLGRFLFGDWSNTSEVNFYPSNACQAFAAAYRDRQNASHRREVTLNEECLDVVDTVAGFRERAVLRWRLPPGEIRRDGQRVYFGNCVIEIGATVSIVRFDIVEGWESRYYLERSPTPVIEIEIEAPGKFYTRVHWLS